MENLKIIKNDNTEEIIEKKSKFIANLIYVESEEEAIEKIKEIKKKHFDARHNCYAYRILENNAIIQRSSDDGEPSGTAGAPMLNILEKNNIVNVLIVVTRYFGGILLGTGGLVKAYTEALQKAINNNELLYVELGYEVYIKYPYNESKKIEYFIKNNNIKILKQNYMEEIEIIIEISKNNYEKLCREFPENVNKKIKYKIEKDKTISKNGLN